MHRQGWGIEALTEAEMLGGQVRTSTEVEYLRSSASGNLPLQ